MLSIKPTYLLVRTSFEPSFLFLFSSVIKLDPVPDMYILYLSSFNSFTSMSFSASFWFLYTILKVYKLLLLGFL